MKASTKLFLLALGVIVCWGLLALVCVNREAPSKTAAKTAKTCLELSVDNPKSLKILKIHPVDSVFGKAYISEDDIYEVGSMMMAVDSVIMEKMVSMKDLDIEDKEFNELMERYSRVTPLVKTMWGLYDKPMGGAFSGWRVKIDYEAVSASNTRIKGQWWSVLDTSGKIILKNFDIPVVAEDTK